MRLSQSLFSPLMTSLHAKYPSYIYIFSPVFWSPVKKKKKNGRRAFVFSPPKSLFSRSLSSLSLPLHVTLITGLLEALLSILVVLLMCSRGSVGAGNDVMRNIMKWCGGDAVWVKSSREWRKWGRLHSSLFSSSYYYFFINFFGLVLVSFEQVLGVIRASLKKGNKTWKKKYNRRYWKKERKVKYKEGGRQDKTQARHKIRKWKQEKGNTGNHWNQHSFPSLILTFLATLQLFSLIVWIIRKSYEKYPKSCWIRDFPRRRLKEVIIDSKWKVFNTFRALPRDLKKKIGE